MTDEPANAIDLQAYALDKARKRIAYRMARELSTQFALQRTEWDEDEAVETLIGLIPQSAAEAEIEMQALDNLMRRPPRPEGPPLLVRLRRAMGLKDDHPLRETLEAAIAQVAIVKKVREARVEAEIVPDNEPPFAFVIFRVNGETLPDWPAVVAKLTDGAV